MTDYVRACAAADVPAEGAIRVVLAGRPVCVAFSEGEYYALSDVCSHAEVALSDGEVEDGTIECWLHGSRFDMTTGRPTGLPAILPIAVHTVRLDGDQVLVALSD